MELTSHNLSFILQSYLLKLPIHFTRVVLTLIDDEISPSNKQPTSFLSNSSVLKKLKSLYLSFSPHMADNCHFHNYHEPPPSHICTYLYVLWGATITAKKNRYNLGKRGSVNFFTKYPLLKGEIKKDTSTEIQASNIQNWWHGFQLHRHGPIQNSSTAFCLRKPSVMFNHQFAWPN